MKSFRERNTLQIQFKLAVDHRKNSPSTTGARFFHLIINHQREMNQWQRRKKLIHPPSPHLQKVTTLSGFFFLNDTFFVVLFLFIVYVYFTETVFWFFSSWRRREQRYKHWAMASLCWTSCQSPFTWNSCRLLPSRSQRTSKPIPETRHQHWHIHTDNNLKT